VKTCFCELCVVRKKRAVKAALFFDGERIASPVYGREIRSTVSRHTEDHGPSWRAGIFR